MNGKALLDWYNAIFFVPMIVSALLLALSSLRIGGHGHNRGIGHIHGGGMPHARLHISLGPRHHPGPVRVGSANGKSVSRENPAEINAMAADLPHHLSPFRSMIAGLFGVGRAPLIIVAELYFLAFGLIGMLVNGTFIHSNHPLVFAVLPSLGIALVGAALFARISAAAFTRIMPDESTAVLSRDSLFGLSGTVTYPVSATGGRVHLYDEFGTLHDESCRTAPGGL